MSNQLHKERPEEPVGLALDSKEFTAFESWLDSELTLLEQAWGHRAAPGAEHRAERVYLHKTRQPK